MATSSSRKHRHAGLEATNSSASLLGHAGHLDDEEEADRGGSRAEVEEDEELPTMMEPRGLADAGEDEDEDEPEVAVFIDGEHVSVPSTERLRQEEDLELGSSSNYVPPTLSPPVPRSDRQAGRGSGSSSGLGQEETPLPMNKIIPIMLLTASESFNSSAIFSYVGYLVLDFDLTQDKKELGNYAGAISSCFFVAQFFSSFFWGKMSDKYGRRPILLWGAVGTIISALLFGFSFNFPFAIFSRALCGLLNGNIGVLKTYLGEVTDSTNQTKAWSWFSLASGAGAVLGALAGGVLAQPASKYPKLFADGHGIFGDVFEEFPYLLPNVMAVVVCGIGLVLSYFYLTENQIPRRATEVERSKYSPLDEDTEEALEVDEEAQDIEMKEMVPVWDVKSEHDSKETEDLRAKVRNLRLEEEQDQKDNLNDVTNGHTNREGSLRLTQSQELGLNDKVDGIEEEGSAPWWRSLRWRAYCKNNGKAKRQKSVLLEGQVLLSTHLYALTGMLFIFIDAVFPLWTMTDPHEGGLGFSTDEIGITSSIGSLSIILIQLFLYGPIAKKLGLVATFKWGTLAAVPVFIGFPMVNYFHPDVTAWSPSALMWILMITIYIIRTFVGQLMFCAVMNLINNSVDVYNMGAANGLGQSLVALFRAIGPYFSSVLFAWSMTNEMPFPFNFYFIFVLMSVTALFILGLAFLLHPSLNTPKPLPTEGDPVRR